MKSSTRLAIAAITLSLMGAGSAQAADVIFHYTFDPGSYFDLEGSSPAAVTGHFDYDVTNSALENVYYDRGGDIFTIGSLNYGSADPVFGDYNSNDYDVYQLANSLAVGGTDMILYGTHPEIGVDGAGVSISSSSVAAVPEPATWALMLAGFGVVGYAMRSRARINFSYA